MKTFAAAVAIIATLSAQVLAQTTGLTINTPANLVVCQPALLNWVDSNSPPNPPYFLSILPGTNPLTSPAIEQFPPTNATSFTWNVNVATGSSITLSLRDNKGAQVFSAPVTIQAGTSSSCVNATAPAGAPAPASTGASTGASSPAGGSSAGAPAATAGSGTSTGGSSSPQSTGSGSAASPAASKASGASRAPVSMGAFGLAGLMGLIGATLL